MEENKVCFGMKIIGRGCNILNGEEKCDGLNFNCPFYKTRKKAIEESDRAIDICRAKGRCWNCKYMQSGEGESLRACKKSTEVEVEE